MAYIFFLILFFLIFKMNFEATNRFNYFILTIPICLALIFVHHASNFQIIPIFLIFFLILAFFNVLLKKNKLIYLPIVIFGLLVLIHWFYVAETFSMTLMQLAAKVITSDMIAYSPQNFIIQQNLIEQNISDIVFTAPIIILLFFVFLGIGMICKQSVNKKLLVFGALAFLSAPFWVPSLITQTIFFVGFVLDRLLLFTAPFIMLIFSYGLYHSIIEGEKKNTYIISIITISFLIYIFVSLGTIPFYDYKLKITNNETSLSPISFDEKDFAFMNFADRFIPSGSSIISDLFVKQYYEGKTYFNGIENYNIKYYKSEYLADFLATPKNSEFEQGYIIFRKEYFENQDFFQSSDKDTLQFEKDRSLEDYFNSFDEIYSSKSNMVYLVKS